MLYRSTKTLGSSTTLSLYWPKPVIRGQQASCHHPAYTQLSSRYSSGDKKKEHLEPGVLTASPSEWPRHSLAITTLWFACGPWLSRGLLLSVYSDLSLDVFLPYPIEELLVGIFRFSNPSWQQHAIVSFISADFHLSLPNIDRNFETLIFFSGTYFVGWNCWTLKTQVRIMRTGFDKKLFVCL